nr:MAG TPA: Cas system-associated protein [Caudoviricetes sp.]
MKDLKIKIGISSFTVYIYNLRLRDITLSLSTDLISYKMEWNPKYKRLLPKKDKLYYVEYEKDNIFIYPLPLLKMYLSMLGGQGIRPEDIEFEVCKNTPLPLNVNFASNKSPREYQQVIVDEIQDPKRKVNFIDLFTGAGKGLVSIYSLIQLNMKVAIIVLPKYIDKWIEELLELTDVKPERIAVIQGSDSLITIMNNLEEYRETKDIFIFSMRTTMFYIEEYVNTSPMAWDTLKYPIDPTKLLDALGVGTILSDEAHQEFHALYTTMLFFNANKLIAMSATLYSHDRRKQYLYSMLFPKSSYCTNMLGTTDHVDVYGIGYCIKKANKIPCERKQGYSQVMFEQYMMTNTRLLVQYLKMLLKYADSYYYKRKLPGEKMLVFCGTVDMCKYMAVKFKKAYPDLTVGTYTQEDEYEVLFKNDITISTLQSAGTGIDLQGLITVLQTISVGSYQANVQAMGRLRKKEGRDMYYVYFYCKNLPKHYDLNRQREESLRDKVKSYTYLAYNELLIR